MPVRSVSNEGSAASVASSTKEALGALRNTVERRLKNHEHRFYRDVTKAQTSLKLLQKLDRTNILLRFQKAHRGSVSDSNESEDEEDDDQLGWKQPERPALSAADARLDAAAKEIEKENTAMALFLARHRVCHSRQCPAGSDGGHESASCERWRRHLGQLLAEARCKGRLLTSAASPWLESLSPAALSAATAKNLNTNAVLLEECSILEDEITRLRVEVTELLSGARPDGLVPWRVVDVSRRPKLPQIPNDQSGRSGWTSQRVLWSRWRDDADQQEKHAFQVVEHIAATEDGLQGQFELIVNHLRESIVLLPQ